MTCKCINVTRYDTGWQCILCGEKFFPYETKCGIVRGVDTSGFEAGEQLPVVEPDTKCYRNYRDVTCYCKDCRS